jgi:P-type Cu+ transporter
LEKAGARSIANFDGLSEGCNSRFDLLRRAINRLWLIQGLGSNLGMMQTVTERESGRLDAAGSRTYLRVDGMTCSGCSRQVKEALEKVPGTAAANVALEEGKATVRWQPNIPQDELALVAAVREAGFRAELADPIARRSGWKRWSPLAGWHFNVIFGGAVFIPLTLLEWGFQVGMERWYQWLAFGLVLPVQVLCGARFYYGAWNQLKVGSSNMDTLVSLGSTTAFVYSTWGLFAGWPGHLYFMESAAILTLISLGHWLETRIGARAASSLRALLNLAPPTARRLAPDGTETEVPVAALVRGERVLLKPGDRVPTDGEVLEGSSVVDESMLTGESMPVEKIAGGKLFAGTVNQDGRLLVRVTATGEETALAHIIEIVQRAQSSRAKIQRLGDFVSSIFVPIVILVALFTALWWGLAPESARVTSQWFEPFLWKPHSPPGALASAVYHAAAVLIIACPCAMGLATPAAIMAGTNVAARRGILIRDGVALERTGRLTAVIFDKTGTLTHGKMSVLELNDFREKSARGIKLEILAASLAQPSNHPLSIAVARLAEAAVPVQDWKEIRGAGVEGRLELKGGDLYRLGSLNWLRQSGADVTGAAGFLEEHSRKGATVLGISTDRKLIGVLAVRDTMKNHAREVVAEITRQGKTVYLITGDNRLTAESIAHQAGIAAERVFAEVRPEGKAEIVAELQRRGERVAFVGDGINDAPALKQANLGIAVSRASDVAREAADIILLNSDIQAIPEALGLSRATLRTIKQNLFWAFFYNTAAIPLAMLGYLSPIVAAVAMGLSDMVVIGNALRLRYWRGPRK